MIKSGTILQKKLNVFDIQRFCLHDGPGIRTTVFLKGCGLRCPWCANPESQSKQVQTLRIANTKNPALPPTLKACGAMLGVEEIMQTVLKDKDYYQNSGGGLTVSGGEPMLQTPALLELLHAAKYAGLSTAIETCGDTKQEDFGAVKALVDYFLFDVKHLDSQKLKHVTQGNAERILSNLRFLASHDADKITVRVPLIPGFNMDSELMNQIFDLLISLGIKKVDLLPYHVLGKNKYQQLGIAYPGEMISAISRAECQILERLAASRGLTVNGA